MTTPASSIVELYNARVKRSGAPMQCMREIASMVDGDIIVPLPELQEDEKPAIANIAKQGIDQTAQRLASVFPEIGTFPMSASKAELERSRDRRRAFYGFHEPPAATTSPLTSASTSTRPPATYKSSLICPRLKTVSPLSCADMTAEESSKQLRTKSIQCVAKRLMAIPPCC